MLRTAHRLTPRIVRSCTHVSNGPPAYLQVSRLLSSGTEGQVIELQTDEAYQHELTAAKGVHCSRSQGHAHTSKYGKSRQED